MNLLDKYNIGFPEGAVKKNIMRLTNQMWKLIPMRENNENWGKQLETVIIEIAGLKEIFVSCPTFLQLLSKLEGLRVEQVGFEIYRKTVFECINIVQDLNND